MPDNEENKSIEEELAELEKLSAGLDEVSSEDKTSEIEEKVTEEGAADTALTVSDSQVIKGDLTEIKPEEEPGEVYPVTMAQIPEKIEEDSGEKLLEELSKTGATEEVLVTERETADEPEVETLNQPEIDKNQTLIISKEDRAKIPKPDTTSWADHKPEDIIRSRGGKEGGRVFYSKKSSFFDPEQDKRMGTIVGLLHLDDTERTHQIVREIVDPFNPKGIIDSNGFLKLGVGENKDENDCRLRVIYQGKGDAEPILHRRKITASNLIIETDLRGEELDLTPIYVDLKAFYDLVDERGPKEAIRLTINDNNALTAYKNKIRKELRDKKKEDIHDDLIKKDMDDYLYEKLGIRATSLETLILKINIKSEHDINDDERLLRAREKAVSRTGIGVKRLCTVKTRGGRDVAIMKEMGTLDIEKAAGLFGYEGILKKIALPVLEDLEQLHIYWGFEHRDIKPDNLFYDKELKRTTLGDFSVAKIAQERSDLTKGQTIGTPQYMSPRQARGEDTNIRDDLYSFGRTLESFLTKEAPYSFESGQEVISALIGGQKPFALTHSSHKETLTEDLGINKWYQYAWPGNLLKLYRRKKFVKNLEKVLAWTCQKPESERGPSSCKEVYEDLKEISEGKKPSNVNAYLKQSGISERSLIESAYETGEVAISEETRVAVKKNTHKWALIAAGLTFLGVGVGSCATKIYYDLKARVEQTNGHVEQINDNK